MLIKVADIVIDINVLYQNDFKTLNDYIVSDVNVDAKITSLASNFNEPLNNLIKTTKFYDLYNENGIIYQHQKDMNNKYFAVIKYNKKDITIFMFNPTFETEYLLTQYAVNYLISNYSNSIFFHSSTIKYNNLGIAFSAKSGTGKSTHRRLWEKYSEAKCINDDKNIITLINDKLYISPNPWCGKHMIQNNISSTLDVIVFLFQSKENVIVDIPKSKAFKLLLSQILPPDNNIELWNKITDKILELPIYYYGCNMEYDAFLTIKERILNDYANK